MLRDSLLWMIEAWDYRIFESTLPTAIAIVITLIRNLGDGSRAILNFKLWSTIIYVPEIQKYMMIRSLSHTVRSIRLYTNNLINNTGRHHRVSSERSPSGLTTWTNGLPEVDEPMVNSYRHQLSVFEWKWEVLTGGWWLPGVPWGS